MFKITLRVISLGPKMKNTIWNEYNIDIRYGRDIL